MTLTLTPVEIGTLREIVESRLESGEYYGNAQQYRKRVETILDKINAEIMR